MQYKHNIEQCIDSTKLNDIQIRHETGKTLARPLHFIPVSKPYLYIVVMSSRYIFIVYVVVIDYGLVFDV